MVTHHGKAQILRSTVEERGWTIEEIDADTDALGTFAGDVPRAASPFETAVRKAGLGRSEDNSWLLASEGTITSSLLLGPVIHELIVALAPERGVVIAGRYVAPFPIAKKLEVDPGMNAVEVERELVATFGVGRFVTVLVRASTPQVVRDVRAGASLAHLVSEASEHGESVLIQTDLRAHRCPERHEVLHCAMNDLLDRLETNCPICRQPGFGVLENVPGLPCSQCNVPTDVTKAMNWRCEWCEYHEEEHVGAESADPSLCQWCNP